MSFFLSFLAICGAAASLLTGNETEVTALEQVDLTSAQKLDARHYPADCVLVFNRNLNGCVRGERGKLIGITAKRLALEVNDKVRHIPLTHLDYINVCRERAFAVSPGDRLQLKANSASIDGRKLANGEVVTVAQIKSIGAIRLTDGRVLPPHYRLSCGAMPSHRTDRRGKLSIMCCSPIPPSALRRTRSSGMSRSREAERASKSSRRTSNNCDMQ